MPQNVEDSEEEAEEGSTSNIKNDPQFSLKALKKVDSEVGIISPYYPDDGEVVPQFVPALKDDEKNSDLIRVKSKKRWIDGITALWGKKKRGGSNRRRLWIRGNNRNHGNGSSEDERIKRRYVLMTPHQYHALKGKSTPGCLTNTIHSAS